MILDFPSGICQTSATILLRVSGGNLVSPWTFANYPQDWGGERWEIAGLSFLPRDRDKHEEVRRLESFLLKIRGGRVNFRYGDPHGSLPKGQASGTPVISGVSTTGSASLATTGWAANITGILKAGDYIQVGDRYHFVLDDADSDGGGNATLNVVPRIREPHASGSPIITKNPRGVFHAAAVEVAFERGVTRTAPQDLSAAETIVL